MADIDQERTTLKCPFGDCEKTFKYPKGLKAHQKSSHSHFHTKCNKCAVLFPTQAKYEEHKLSKQCKRFRK